MYTMKPIILGFLVLTVLCVFISAKSLSGSEKEESQAVDLLRRITRETAKPKSNATCKYQKGPWSACDQSTKKRTRTFSLKKGSKECDPVKILSKDCKGKRQKQKNNSKNRDRQRQNKKQEKSKNKQV